MTEPTTRAACTIISPNYLPFARTVAASYLAQHPEDRFFVLLVAGAVDLSDFAAEPYIAVALSDIGLENLSAEAMKYDILELNTNVKPTFMKHLIHQYRLTCLIYLDPDISCYAPLDPVYEMLESHDAVLTPHITTPVFDGKIPGEQELLYNGTFNLGFFAVRNSQEGLRLLDWWERRCLDLGFSEGRTGLFVDQKWMNLAPALFEHVKILRHPGCNTAYWNLHERVLAKTPDGYSVQGPDGEAPLCFFHFSGIVPSDPKVLSKHTDRFTLAQRPDLTMLFAEYKARVLANADPVLESIPYGFDIFSDGIAINRLVRRLYSKHQSHFPGDPFDASGTWANYVRSHGLVAGKAKPGKATWNEFSTKDRRVAMVHRLFRVTLRILGPNRYELLMRYLAHIAVLRNQSIFLNQDLPDKSDHPAEGSSASK